MLTSTRWINDYLDPPASAEEQAELLTRAGFPLEGTETVELPGGSTDARQDFEMTSNRGDCVSHLGLAREIAALSGRTVRPPEVAPKADASTPASAVVKVTNREPERCPLYTARIIRGVTVRPSPDWLRDRLLARGDIPRNNIVDATNFVLFELGHPAHVFDLAKLAGPEIIVRLARDKEPFLPLGEGSHPIELDPDDLVIADAERAVALGGVKGGAETAVSESTTDILIEAATFTPVTVRTTSRRHGIVSESSYRYERGVHAGAVNAAADRLADLILELAGGTLCEGVVQDGAPIPAPQCVAMRPARCRHLLGIDVPDGEMVEYLQRLGFAPRIDGEHVRCTVPLHRLDIQRETDLIEEVARMHGLDAIPVEDSIRVRVPAPQPEEEGRQAVARELVGLGFVETITHALVSEAEAQPFMPRGAVPLRVDDERARATPVLRPSILSSLLHVRRTNRDGGVDELALFEWAATFHDSSAGEHTERVRLGLLLDQFSAEDGTRPLRGAIERIVRILAGRHATITVEPDDACPWFAPSARVIHDGRTLGGLGLIHSAVAKQFDLDRPLLAAELDLEHLLPAYPPDAQAQALPIYPAIARDLSVIVTETTRWCDLDGAVKGLGLPDLRAIEFVTNYRGKQVGAGRKSTTMRLVFRSDERTLTHDEVDPAVRRAAEALTALGGEIRT